MKKAVNILFLVVLSLAVMCGYADAISGLCSSCHTMHNSQGGAAVDSDGVNERLAKDSCVGCHTGATGKTTADSAPIVFHTSAPAGQGGSDTLAGGDFYWVATSGGATDAKGHNVEGLAAEDATIGNDPPGWDQTATTGVTVDSKTLQVTGGAGWGTTQLSCAGTFGCHGTRDQTGLGGIQGSHHNNPGLNSVADTASTVANSYRFLAGIKGLENGNWNYGETQAAHNEYYGANSTGNRNYDAGATTYTNKATVSYLCAECHGLFHSKAANDSSYASGDPWRRHPSDITLPNSGEYATYNPDDTNKYNLSVPVARPTVPADCTGCATVTPGTDIVMCLSCHRAHGSPVADLMRFTYDMQVETGTTDSGCFVCHTAKNAD